VICTGKKLNVLSFGDEAEEELDSGVPPCALAYLQTSFFHYLMVEFA
jgi:hypothetical protein